MKKRLRLVRGNDSYLAVPVRNIVFVRDSEGRISKSELSVALSDCSVLDVNVVCECGLSKAASYTISGSCLIVKVAADMDLPIGWYGLEVKYKLSGRQYRSYERDVFKIVENNGKSFVSGEQYSGEQSYQVDTMYTLMSIIDEDDLLAISERSQVYERGTGENSVQQKGTGSQAIGDNSHAEGSQTIAGIKCKFEDPNNEDEYHFESNNAHAEGYKTRAYGENSHAEGRQTEAGTVPTVETGDGYMIVSGGGGENAHAEGYRTKATGKDSHAEGDGTVASNTQAHSEGKDTTASGKEAHSEGRNTEAAGQAAHAEGYSCHADGTGSHAGGMASSAKSDASIAQGYCVNTTNIAEAAFGRYNISNTGSSKSECTILSIGIGKKESERKNAIEVREDGSIFFWMGGEYVKLQDFLAAVMALVEATNGEIGINDAEAIPDTGGEDPFTGDIVLPPDEPYYYHGSIGTWDE